MILYLSCRRTVSRMELWSCIWEMPWSKVEYWWTNVFGGSAVSGKTGHLESLIRSIVYWLGQHASIYTQRWNRLNMIELVFPVNVVIAKHCKGKSLNMRVKQLPARHEYTRVRVSPCHRLGGLTTWISSLVTYFDYLDHWWINSCFNCSNRKPLNQECTFPMDLYTPPCPNVARTV